MTDVWTKWETLVINGVFPLRRFLSRSNHSVVFLSEYKARNLPDAAIKLIPADPVLAEARLSRWRTVAALSHPHLIRLLEAGRCQLGGHQFLFVVMEYADQTLAQLLLHRPLTAEEVREMLSPTLDALAFLHRKNFVHGRLKPPNFLVVNDQLKLASDTVRLAGVSTASIAKPSVYDPPEAKDGATSAAGDIWSLGVIIVEALTRSAPTWSNERSETVSLPATLPPEFADLARRCLNRNPADRPTIPELQAIIRRAPAGFVETVAPPVSAATAAPAVFVEMPAPPTPASTIVPPVPKATVPSPASMKTVPAPSVGKAPDRAAAAPPKPPRWLIPAGGVLLVGLIAVWAGTHLFHSRPAAQQPAAGIPETPSRPPAAALPEAAVTNPKTPTSAAPAVLHQEIPDVPQRARQSIRGHIKVTVRVTVDRAGNVVGAAVAASGRSKYFARLATEAARKWRFAPSDSPNSREWLLQFDFARSAITGTATARS
jgi:TonB family protein